VSSFLRSGAAQEGADSPLSSFFLWARTLDAG
jgi:hypothetical protein